MKRIPLLEVQKAIYQRLSECQSVPVFDNIPDDGESLDGLMPFIAFGAFTCAAPEQDTKDGTMARVTVNIEIYSAYDGRKELQNIATDLVFLLTSPPLYVEGGYSVIDQGVTFFQSFQEEWEGYHGALTFEILLNDEGESLQN